MERDKVNMQTLEATAGEMVADGEGLLAIDETSQRSHRKSPPGEAK